MTTHFKLFDVNGEPVHAGDYMCTTVYEQPNFVLVKVVEILSPKSVIAYQLTHSHKEAVYANKQFIKISYAHPIYTYPEEWVIELYPTSNNDNGGHKLLKEMQT